jgi:hypothetical protein
VAWRASSTPSDDGRQEHGIAPEVGPLEQGDGDRLRVHDVGGTREARLEVFDVHGSGGIGHWAAA